MTDHPQRPSFTHARRGSTRSTGLLVAVGVGLAAAGLVGYVAFMKPKPEDAPRIKPPAIPAETLGGAPGDRQGNAEGVRIELADKKDPTRVASVLLAKSVKPQQGRLVEVEQPGALVFLRDGRTLRIKARNGSFSSFSTEQAPERGTFSGDVRLLVYGPIAAASSRTMNWDAQKPLIDASLGDTFEFDLTFGKAVVPGRFSILSDDFRIQGEQAEIVLDEAAAALRMLRIAKDARIERLAVKHTPSEAPGAAAGGETPATTPTEAAYRVSIVQPVDIVAGTKGSQRTISAASADGFLRLVDNKLRPTAIAKLTTTPTAATSPATPDNVQTDPAKPQNTTTPPAETQIGPEDAFILTTSGALEIKLADAPPPELARNDLYVRMRGSDEKPVRFADEAANASGFSPVVEYGATRGDVTLAGERASSIELTRAGDGTFTAQRFTLNVPTRIGQSIGSGRVMEAMRPPQIGEPEQRARAIDWSDQADFEFGSSAKSNAWEIRRSQFSGNVIGADGVSGFNAAFLVAEFGPRSQPSHVNLSGTATAHDGTRGVLKAEAIDVAFSAREGGRSEPDIVTASGAVEARDKDRALTGDLVEAKLGKDDKGKTAVIDLVAKENVVFGAAGGATVMTNELRAKPQQQIATLIGPDTAISQDAASVRGSLIRLDGAASTLVVDGPGTFSTTGEEGKGPLAAQGSWTGSMSYNDKTGELDAKGNVSGVSLTDAATIDKLTADHVTARIAKTEIVGEAPPESTIPPPKQVRRDLVLVTARSVEGSGNAMPHVESKTYDGPVGFDAVTGRRMIQTRSLDGASIVANIKDGTLNMHGAGKALMLDRREQPDAPEEPGDNALASMKQFRGAALFEWRDAMGFTRETGVVDLAGGVKITNDRPADKSLIYFESDKAVAKLSGLNAAKVERVDVLEADAIGNVFARFKTAKSERELNAFRAVYGAKESSLRLLAAEGGEVSLFDTATATPVKASELVWDLAQDRVEIVKPSAITAPVVNPPR